MLITSSITIIYGLVTKKKIANSAKLAAIYHLCMNLLIFFLII